MSLEFSWIGISCMIGAGFIIGLGIGYWIGKYS